MASAEDLNRWWALENAAEMGDDMSFGDPWDPTDFRPHGGGDPFRPGGPLNPVSPGGSYGSPQNNDPNSGSGSSGGSGSGSGGGDGGMKRSGTGGMDPALLFFADHWIGPGVISVGSDPGAGDGTGDTGQSGIQSWDLPYFGNVLSLPQLTGPVIPPTTPTPGMGGSSGSGSSDGHSHGNPNSHPTGRSSGKSGSKGHTKGRSDLRGRKGTPIAATHGVAVSTSPAPPYVGDDSWMPPTGQRLMNDLKQRQTPINLGGLRGQTQSQAAASTRTQTPRSSRHGSVEPVSHRELQHVFEESFENYKVGWLNYKLGTPEMLPGTGDYDDGPFGYPSIKAHQGGGPVEGSSLELGLNQMEEAVKRVGSAVNLVGYGNLTQGEREDYKWWLGRAHWQHVTETLGGAPMPGY